MKQVSFLACLIAFIVPAYAYGQDTPPAEPPVAEAPVEAEAPTTEAPETVADDAAPAESDGEPQVTAPEPEVAEPEPEVAAPEPEVAAPEPEVAEPDVPAPADSEGGGELGSADAAAPVTTPTVDEDLADADGEANPPAEGDDPDHDAHHGDEDGDGRVSAAERLASAAGGQGLPWTFPINWTHNLSIRTLSAGAQQTHNPTYSWTFSAAPRYIFSPAVSIGASMTLDIELTDSNLTPTSQDFEWGDLRVDATFVLPWTPLGISIRPRIQLRIPTGQFSQAQARALGPTAAVTAIKAFSVAHGLIFGASVAYTGWIRHSGYRTLSEGTAGPDSFFVNNSSHGGQSIAVRPIALCPNAAGEMVPCTGGNQVQHQTSLALFGVFLPADGVAISASFAAIWLNNYEHADSCINNVVTSTGDCLTVVDNSRTHMNFISQLSLGVSYDFNSYLTGSIGYNTLAFQPDTDGSFENFFINENTSLTLGIQFRPAAVAAMNMADDEEEEEESGEAASAANSVFF